MDASAIIEQLIDLGVSVQLNGPKVRLEPGSLVPPALLDEVKRHKDEIIKELRRPPESDEELGQLIDHLANPECFDKWLNWALEYKDPAEDLQQSP